MSNFIPEHIIEEIRSRADIIEVISEHVPLKRSGKNHKGLCPFHSEKTPSFTVNSEKQIYHCFGCGMGGNVFKFLMEIENLSFVEVVQKLGQRFQVNIPNTTTATGFSPNRNEKERLIDINQLAAKHFYSLLKGSSGKKARDYLYKRGFNEEVINQFELGWATANWRDLLTNFERIHKCSPKILEKFGLVSKKMTSEGKDKEVYFDRFRERVIFPIKDSRGNVIGFGGRILDKGEPKYLNSPETLVYKKGNHLYGLHSAKESIRKEKQVLIMEGYFDHLRAWQYGIYNSVATCGTAITSKQANLLRQYTDQVILVFDADAAGQKAAFRGYEVLSESGLQVKVVSLPLGHDPDSLILKEGSELFLNRVKNASPFLKYLVDQTVNSIDTKNTEGKLEALNQILPVLVKVKNVVERTEYTKYCADSLKISDKALLEEIKKALNQNIPKTNLVKDKKRPSTQSAEWYLIHLLLDNEKTAQEICREVPLDCYEDRFYRETAGLIYEWLADGEPVRVDRLIDRTEEADIKSVLTEISLSPMVFDNISKAKAECIAKIKNREVQKQINELRKQRQEAEQAGETHKSRLLQEQVHKMRLSLIPE